NQVNNQVNNEARLPHGESGARSGTCTDDGAGSGGARASHGRRDDR
ncbi:MAG: hypothetical protein ACJA2J_002193, partial [Candidatus Azotimanducaceae bacterium]